MGTLSGTDSNFRQSVQITTMEVLPLSKDAPPATQHRSSPGRRTQILGSMGQDLTMQPSLKRLSKAALAFLRATITLTREPATPTTSLSNHSIRFLGCRPASFSLTGALVRRPALLDL